jgi:hypothetical protein
LRVTVNGKTVVFHHANQKTLDDEQIRQMRHFLHDVGLQPEHRAKGP